MTTLVIVAVNKDSRHLICEDDTTLLITNLIDYFGDDTDNFDLAFAYVCQLPNNSWLTLTREHIFARIQKVH
jgi:hypothetical protein